MYVRFHPIYSLHVSYFVLSMFIYKYIFSTIYIACLCIYPVSYTHLDVYKRQVHINYFSSAWWLFLLTIQIIYFSSVPFLFPKFLSYCLLFLRLPLREMIFYFSMCFLLLELNSSELVSFSVSQVSLILFTLSQASS